MWVWRDDVTPGVDRGGWQLDAYDTWHWDTRSPLERVGAGTGALTNYAGRSDAGDRAIAAIGAPPPEYTPIFHAMTEDRTQRSPWVGARVPEPHPGSGPLPIQDAPREPAARGLAAVPTVPPPPVGDDRPLSAEEELRLRAERRRRPRAAETPAGGGRHTMRPRAETPEGRHALRR